MVKRSGKLAQPPLRMAIGIYDREYYRKETPSYLGSFTERGRICKYLIVVNVAFFVLQLVTLPPREERFAIIEGRPAVSNGPFTDALQLDADAVLHGQV